MEGGSWLSVDDTPICMDKRHKRGKSRMLLLRHWAYTILLRLGRRLAGPDDSRPRDARRLLDELQAGVLVQHVPHVDFVLPCSVTGFRHDPRATK